MKPLIFLSMALLIACVGCSSSSKSQAPLQPSPPVAATPEPSPEPVNYYGTWNARAADITLEGEVYNGLTNGQRSLKFVTGQSIMEVTEMEGADESLPTCLFVKTDLDRTFTESDEVNCQFMSNGVLLKDENYETTVTIAFDESTSPAEQALLGNL